MTSAATKPTEKWVADKGAIFPYGYDSGGRLSNELGVTGIPHAFLVNPGGKIVWQGHPARLDDATIEKHLDGALTRPLYSWPAAAGKVKKAFLKGDFAGALDAAGKLAKDDPFGEEVAGIVRGVLEGRLATYAAALEKGDVLTAYAGYKALSKGLKGMDEEATVKDGLKTISKDKQLKAILKTQEKLADILVEAGEVRRRKDCDAVIDALEKLLKKNEDGFVGSEIRARIKDMREKKGQLAR